MRKTFLYKAKINKMTEGNCNHWLELCRTLYNLALEQRISIWQQYKKNIFRNEQNKQLKELKREFSEFKNVNSQVLENVLQRLDLAYISFFKRMKRQNGKAGFPRFKGYNRYDSFTLRQHGWKLEGRYLYIRHVGRFKLFLSRPIQGRIKTITVRRTKTNNWLVSFSCDNVPKGKFPETNKEIGIDVGIKVFAVDSDGNQIENPQYFRQSEKLLRCRQRMLSRRKKGSNRRNKARLLVAKAYEKIANQRKDFLHKTSNFYIKQYNKIYIENLKISNMRKNKYLSKSISDSSWGIFFKVLSRKAEEADRTVIKVKPNGTSQICSGCGEKVHKSLSIRVHKCPFCNLVLDRDHNASLNILRFGQNRQALTDRSLTAVV